MGEEERDVKGNSWNDWNDALEAGSGQPGAQPDPQPAPEPRPHQGDASPWPAASEPASAGVPDAAPTADGWADGPAGGPAHDPAAASADVPAQPAAPSPGVPGANWAVPAATATSGQWPPPGGPPYDRPTPPQPPRRRRGFAGTIAIALISAIVGGLVVAYAAPSLSPRFATEVAPPTVTVAQSPTLNDSPAVAVAAKVSPSIVLVINQSTSQTIYGATQQQEASGSGIIFDSRGYIVTDDHVVYGASKLTVVLHNGTALPATIVGEDAPTDLAVIKVNYPKPLPTATFGNSDKLVPGQMAIAIGNPLGTNLTDSVTTGVVSGIRNQSYGFAPPGSTGAANQRVTQVIQTDAPINPGNSGGALLNSAGQVIGITAYKTVTAEPGVPAAGIGFAIPSNTVVHVITDLMKYGHVRRGYIGVTLSSPAQSLPGQSVPVTISSIVPGGPAAKAGLQIGDQIVSVNGVPVKNTDDVIAEVNKYEPGQTISLGILRNGKTISVKVTLTSLAPSSSTQGG